jgi:hypothetical protein
MYAEQALKASSAFMLCEKESSGKQDRFLEMESNSIITISGEFQLIEYSLASCPQ